jgi:hypothetical protein
MTFRVIPFGGVGTWTLAVLGGLAWNSAVAEPAPPAPLAPPALLSSEVHSPPIPPVPTPPVDVFRELLAMNLEERKQALMERPVSHRRILMAKLREYDLLPAEQRELRLRVTELRWHLIPLMKLPPAERGPRLERLSEDDRRILLPRLEEWDRLSPAARQQLLEHEATIHYFLQLESSTPAQREALLQEMSPARREKLETDLERWRAYPAEERQRMYGQFQQFFELTEREQEKTLNTFSDAERRQMEKTLDKFAQLAPEQRRRCLESFSKFANMSPLERRKFLRNAERWQAMTPSERQAWRQLVDHLPQVPPLPPGFVPPPPAFPGMNVATNAVK